METNQIKPRNNKIIYIVVGIVALFILALILMKTIPEISPRPPKQNSSTIKQARSADFQNNSQFIQADFIDIDRIAQISKFRSGSGHDFSSGGESCRSMKHYYNVPYSRTGDSLRDPKTGMPPPPDGKNDIAIYSPVDGEITRIEKEQAPIGEQIYIEPDNHPKFTIRLFHIYKLEGIEQGSRVKAGQQIGLIGQYSNTDIAVMDGRKFISYFEVMPDRLFAKYQARGIKERSELIISKEYRDANPLRCNGERFAENYDSDPNSGNFVNLK